MLCTCMQFDVVFYREESFPRLGSMILDYDTPLKKIAEQFVPHQQVSIRPNKTKICVFPVT